MYGFLEIRYARGKRWGINRPVKYWETVASVDEQSNTPAADVVVASRGSFLLGERVREQKSSFSTP